MTTNDKNADPLRILLVEDSIESMNLTKRMLIDLGITQIFTAKNGSEAFDLIGSLGGEDFIDLVLCDWHMPVMNGMELLRQIRTSYPDLLFVIITGQADHSSVAEAKAFGVSGFIKKPFSPVELGKKLDVASRIISHRKLDALVS